MAREGNDSMCMRTFLGILTVIPLVVGCSTNWKGWTAKPSSPARDPLVMSHLTHSKEDPMYAEGENEDFFHPERNVKSVSISRKPIEPLMTPRGSSGLAHAEDYSWIEGRLERERGDLANGNGPGERWVLRYARSDQHDRFGGRLALAPDPRFGLLREGDRVLIQGRLEETTGQPLYLVRAIEQVGP